MRSFVLAFAFFAANAYALPSLSVPEDVWQSLEPHEKAAIQKSHLVETVPTAAYGLLLDNQGVDRSTPGSNAGTALGSSVAQAAYIDRAINHGNYSAKTQLGVAIVGALIGASLDQPGQQRYEFRYAVKMADGSIGYHHKISGDPFRHPAGACVLVPSIELAPNQKLCTITAASLRQEYFAQPATVPSPPPERAGTEPRAEGSQVTCKIGAIAPIATTLEKCNQVNGRVIND